MKYLYDTQLDGIVGGDSGPFGVAITNTITGNTNAVTGNTQGLENGVLHALSIVGRNPTPLLFNVVPK